MNLYKVSIKRILDFLAAFVGLLIISPLFLVLSICLYILNNGHPFFYQERTGKNGKLFTIIKFKTMNDNTDKDGNLLPALERVTKIGDFCRKLSLDELPQLLNILKGDMSLIGPRPLLPKYIPHYNERQFRRHDVLPGITGWAQVNGRNTISWEQKFEYDVYYVEHLSCALDFKIVLKTIDKVINRADINNSENLDMPEFKGTDQY
ncbi:lipopolysaccharide/colanic/teichoic acid biosynthesis glycosyltransferase [Gelidibacter algens]|uniref:Lipopolysaccharide/colanic/teichoic acid biosynthesis glycosyltransferase n=1 Tax=Gelidibacter algens TaxID=49280 RepID=A0A1A7QNP9_9FLAO|nr:sugar transferase [Gelidibacter algens]OBX21685.1 UDP-galactose phosphate transferase [Gelidibacter algens]RAJ27440.1 lipopolysaccharide/colanic/teichoic acid biosynthesis glycosyltransferase [Gelidibacter algens]